MLYLGYNKCNCGFPALDKNPRSRPWTTMRWYRMGIRGFECSAGTFPWRVDQPSAVKPEGILPADVVYNQDVGWSVTRASC
jgi:hypothetical protein